jgi:Na+-translocating ferredoxin:NAD+ oxidoreductase RnfD subunit
MKSSHGTFAAIVWIVAGALLYNTEPEARLISWQTPVYFLVGMFAASALFGNLSYATVRGVTHALVSTKIITAPTRRAEIGLTVTGCVLFALEAALIYIIARWTVRVMFN